MDHILIKQMFYANVKAMIQDDFPDLDVLSLRYEDYSKSTCQILNPKNVDMFWENSFRRPGSIIVSKLKTNQIEITDGILVYHFNSKAEIINALYTFFPETKVSCLLSYWNVTLVMCDNSKNVFLQTSRPFADEPPQLEFPYFNNVHQAEFKNVVINCDKFPLDYQNIKFLRLEPNTNNFLAVCEASAGMIDHIMTRFEPQLLPFLPFYRKTPRFQPMSSSSQFIIETYLSVNGSFLSEIKI